MRFSRFDVYQKIQHAVTKAACDEEDEKLCDILEILYPKLDMYVHKGEFIPFDEEI